MAQNNVWRQPHIKKLSFAPEEHCATKRCLALTLTVCAAQRISMNIHTHASVVDVISRTTVPLKLWFRVPVTK